MRQTISLLTDMWENIYAEDHEVWFRFFYSLDNTVAALDNVLASVPQQKYYAGQNCMHCKYFDPVEYN